MSSMVRISTTTVPPALPYPRALSALLLALQSHHKSRPSPVPLQHQPMSLEAMVLAWTTFGPPMPRNVLFRTKSDAKAVSLVIKSETQSQNCKHGLNTALGTNHVYRSLVQVGVYELEWSVLVRVIFRLIYLHNLNPTLFFQLKYSF